MLDLRKVHFIREILVLDKMGRKVPRIQVSYARSSDLKPTFVTIPAKYQKEMKILYEDMGGGRLKDWLVGLTLIIPERKKTEND
jgi:hypothetical protein